MSEKLYRVALAVIALGAVGVLGWVIWSSGSGGGSGEDDFGQEVLCSECKYFGEMTMSDLAPLAPGGGGRAAMAPAYGAGYKCPKCGKQTLYTNPIKCPKCGTRFLVTSGPGGVPLDTCPKCSGGG